MEAGVEVWLKQIAGDQAWEPATVQSKKPTPDGKQEILCVTLNGQERKFM